MKFILNTLVALAIGGATSAMAQIDSPHNYKRPVSQKSSQKSTAVAVTPGKMQNNVLSAHNYKRQGSANVEQESSVVVNVPVIGPASLNPIELPAHYKSHAKGVQPDERIARKAKQKEAKTDTLSK